MSEKLPVTQANFEKFIRPMLPYFYNVHSNWPIMCCDWTSKEILPQVRKVFKGEFSLAVGWYCPEAEEGIGHTWIIETETRAFLDPTVGQFRNLTLADLRARQARPGYRVFLPDDPEYKLYRIDAVWQGVRDYERGRRRSLHQYLSEMEAEK